MHHPCLLFLATFIQTAGVDFSRLARRLPILLPAWHFPGFLAGGQPLRVSGVPSLANEGLITGDPYLLLPALFLGFAIFAILSIAGLLLLRPFREEDSAEDTPWLIEDPPGDLFPAQAGLLIAPGNLYQWDQAFACLLELARRRNISVEETLSGSGLDPLREYHLQLQSRQASVLAFEAGLVGMMFLGNEGLEQKVSLSEVAFRFQARKSRFYDPLAGTLYAKGLLDVRRAEALIYLQRLEQLALLIALPGIVAAVGWVAVAGWYGFFIPAGCLAGALLLGQLRQDFTICSAQGQTEVARWRAYAAHLSGPLPVPLESGEAGSFENRLAYAAAFGLGLDWAQQLKGRQDFDVPAWFQPASNGQARLGYTGFLLAAAMLDSPPGLPGISDSSETT